MSNLADISLRSARFRAEREKDWQQLEGLVGKVERGGLRTLSFDEAKALAALYRQSVNSLSLARAISLDKNLLGYLESLAARAYLAVYAPQDRLGGLVWRLLSRGIPQAARRRAPQVLMGFLTLFLGALAGYLLFFDDASWYNTFMPPELAGGRGLNASAEDLKRSIYDRTIPSMEDLSAFASFLFSHNTRIAIFVFALGVLVCVPSAMITFTNGMAFGAFVALHVDRGVGMDIAGWLSIHGVTELSAICIACGGGYVMGLAILFPGQMTRRDALRHAGRDAVKLAVLAGMMLIVAAILEGYFRQIVQDTETRLTIGWGIGALWLAWLTLAGRRA